MLPVLTRILLFALFLPVVSLEGVAPAIAVNCNCIDGRVCGTGTVGDPFRCCNVAKDSCNSVLTNNPCEPLRCATEPLCCSFIFEPCSSDNDCGGRPGSCDLSFGVCTAPCEPSVVSACGAASRICQRYGGSSYQVPEDTPCDDGMICTIASPVPILVDCVGTGTGGGPDCTRDRPAAGATSSDCPASAPICSGSNSVFGGNGGAIVGGRCCPEGTACDLDTGQCRGNFGSGTNSNDVCRAGTCSHDTDACSASAEAAADASLTVSQSSGSSVQVSWTPACNATDHAVYWGTGPIVGAPNWTGAACGLGTVGTAQFDPGDPPPGTFIYFVVVGRTALSEGSYGRSSAGVERPEAVGVGACDIVQVIGSTCGP